MDYNDPDFEQLPPEIKAMIFSANPDILRKSYEVSKEIIELTKYEYLRKFCKNIPFTTTDYQKYLISSDVINKIGVFSFPSPYTNSDLVVGYMLGVYEFNFISNKYDAIILDIKEQGNVLTLNITRSQISIDVDYHLAMYYSINQIIDNKVDLDLLNLYNMYSRRRNCVRLDPDYAETETINHFRRDLAIYSKDKAPINILLLYIYLRANAYLLGLVDQIRYINPEDREFFGALIREINGDNAQNLNHILVGHHFPLKSHYEFNFDKFDENDFEFYNHIQETIKDLPQEIEDFYINQE